MRTSQGRSSGCGCRAVLVLFQFLPVTQNKGAAVQGGACKSLPPAPGTPGAIFSPVRLQLTVLAFPTPRQGHEAAAARWELVPRVQPRRVLILRRHLSVGEEEPIPFTYLSYLFSALLALFKELLLSFCEATDVTSPGFPHAAKCFPFGLVTSHFFSI